MNIMIQQSLPSVVFIDDEPEETRSQRQLDLREHARTQFLSPSDITWQLLRSADLVLVDFDLRHWSRPELGSSNDLFFPRDGLALLTALRASVERSLDLRGSAALHPARILPTAFALHTGHLDLLPGGDRARGREYVLAHAYNVEWIFTKQRRRGEPLFGVQVESLARAARAVVRSWSAESREEAERARTARRALVRLLRLPARAAWRDHAWREVEECHPPLGDLATATHGLALLRWLVLRILPYPCFLLDDRHLAARLQVDPKALRASLQTEDSRLARALQPARYSGVAAEFLGVRWWRAGVETILWRLTKGLVGRAAIDALLAKLDPSLRTVSAVHPVVCLNERLMPSDKLAEIDAALEMLPDDWPPYAERAWVTRELVEDHPDLRAFLVSEAQAVLG
jgi:hypothetical protein